MALIWWYFVYAIICSQKGDLLPQVGRDLKTINNQLVGEDKKRLEV